MTPLSPLVVGQLRKSAGMVYPVSTEMAKTVNPICEKISEPVIIDYGVDIDNVPLQYMQLKIITGIEPEKEIPESPDLYSLLFPVDPIQDYFSSIYQQIETEYAKRLSALDRLESKTHRRAESMGTVENTKRSIGWVSVWKIAETRFAASLLLSYAAFIIVGLFMALPVGFENFTLFMFCVTVTVAALFAVGSLVGAALLAICYMFDIEVVE